MKPKTSTQTATTATTSVRKRPHQVESAWSDSNSLCEFIPRVCCEWIVLVDWWLVGTWSVTSHFLQSISKELQHWVGYFLQENLLTVDSLRVRRTVWSFSIATQLPLQQPPVTNPWLILCIRKTPPWCWIVVKVEILAGRTSVNYGWFR